MSGFGQLWPVGTDAEPIDIELDLGAAPLTSPGDDGMRGIEVDIPAGYRVDWDASSISCEDGTPPPPGCVGLTLWAPDWGAFPPEVFNHPFAELCSAWFAAGASIAPFYPGPYDLELPVGPAILAGPHLPGVTAALRLLPLEAFNGERRWTFDYPFYGNAGEIRGSVYFHLPGPQPFRPDAIYSEITSATAPTRDIAMVLSYDTSFGLYQSDWVEFARLTLPAGQTRGALTQTGPLPDAALTVYIGLDGDAYGAQDIEVVLCEPGDVFARRSELSSALALKADTITVNAQLAAAQSATQSAVDNIADEVAGKADVTYVDGKVGDLPVRVDALDGAIWEVGPTPGITLTFDHAPSDGETVSASGTSSPTGVPINGSASTVSTASPAHGDAAFAIEIMSGGDWVEIGSAVIPGAALTGSVSIPPGTSFAPFDTPVVRLRCTTSGGLNSAEVLIATGAGSVRRSRLDAKADIDPATLKLRADQLPDGIGGGVSGIADVPGLPEALDLKADLAVADDLDTRLSATENAFNDVERDWRPLARTAYEFDFGPGAPGAGAILTTELPAGDFFPHGPACAIACQTPPSGGGAQFDLLFNDGGIDDTIASLWINEGQTTGGIYVFPAAEGAVLANGTLKLRCYDSAGATGVTAVLRGTRGGTLATRALTDALDGRLDTVEADLTTRPSGGAFDTLAARVTASETAIDAKAAQSALDALTTTVAAKAAQSELDALTTTVAGKAPQSAVDALRFVELPGGIDGKPAASARVHDQLVRKFAFALPAGAGEHGAQAIGAATAQAVFSITKNGSQIGTMTFAAGATTATFAITSQTAFAAGDRLAVISPASSDATLSDLVFTFVGAMA